MAPRTTRWFQERPWDAPTKGLAWLKRIRAWREQKHVMPPWPVQTPRMEISFCKTVVTQALTRTETDHITSLKSELECSHTAATLQVYGLI